MTALECTGFRTASSAFVLDRTSGARAPAFRSAQPRVAHAAAAIPGTAARGTFPAAGRVWRTGSRADVVRGRHPRDRCSLVRRIVRAGVGKTRDAYEHDGYESGAHAFRCLARRRCARSAISDITNQDQPGVFPLAFGTLQPISKPLLESDGVSSSVDSNSGATARRLSVETPATLPTVRATS
jgi:hypothetical protein